MWYALVHDEQLGPMPDTELAELHGQGVISDETLVWTATMSDWRPVSEVAEIQALLADPGLFDDEEEGEGATMMMAAGDSDWAALLGAQPAPVDLGTPVVTVERAPEPQAPTEMLDQAMLGDDLLEPLEPVAEPRGILGPPLPGPPMPSMPNLGGDGDDEPGEGSIIDRFPDAPPPMEEAPLPDFGAAAFEAPADAGPAVVASGGDGNSKLPLILLLLLLLGGGGAAVWFLVIDKSGDQPGDAAVSAATTAPTTSAPATVASATPKTAPPVAAAPDAGVEADAMVIGLEDLEPEAPATDAPASVAPSSVASAASSSKAPASVASAAPVSKKAPRSVAAASPKTRRPRPVRPKAPATKRARPSTKAPRKPSGNLPVQLSRAHIVGVLQRSGGRLRTCASLDEKVKQGTFSVNVTIKRSGVVHSAKVVTGRLRKSPAAKCIEGQVKRFRFGAFTGDPMRIQLPFKL